MFVSPRLAGVAGVMGVLALVSGLGAHKWTEAHVAYYTGDTPKATSCVACHFSAQGGTLADRLLAPKYRSPLDLALCADGSRLYVTGQESGTLLEIDPAAGKVVREIPVGRRPNSVTLSARCDVAYVSNQDDDTVSIVDLARGEAIGSLPTGSGPAGLALGRDGRTLFVADSRGEDIGILDLETGAERGRLAGPAWPYGAALSPAGDLVLIGSQLAQPARPPAAPVSEITVVDARRGRVSSRLSLPNAHLVEGIAFTPEGDLALAALVRPRNLLPVLQVERGWMMTNGLGVIDVASGRIAQLPLDDPEEFFADPSDVAVSPDGRLAFVSHGGADAVSVVDLRALRALLAETPDERLPSLANRLSIARRYVIGRIRTGSNPRGLAIAADGRLLYVAERLDDRVGLFDTSTLERAGAIELNESRHETLARRGEKVFNSAAFTLQRQFSCRSCHPENHMDRLQYDFEPDGLGRNMVDNRTLLGLKGTGPFKWNGRNTSLYMQCGIRFARFLMRTEPIPPDDLNALAAFLLSLEHPRSPGAPAEPTAAQIRGREIFERAARRDGSVIPAANRCVTCHPAPLYTDRSVRDVGSASATDSERAFDTPGLENLRLSAPYLHDGKAISLEEIWTVYSPRDTHGVTSDLGKDGLNDLIEYLRTL